MWPSEEVVFPAIATLQGEEVIPGYRGKFVHSATMTIAHWDIRAGYHVPRHSHPHEMIVNMIEGEFEMTIGGTTKRMAAGDVAIVPANVSHGALAITDCRCIDIFSPPREDYRSRRAHE
jgi:quercetin dioxygenase-like cupin family protein